MVVVALLSVDLVKPVDLVSVELVVNCILVTVCRHPEVDPCASQTNGSGVFLS